MIESLQDIYATKLFVRSQSPNLCVCSHMVLILRLIPRTTMAQRTPRNAPCQLVACGNRSRRRSCLLPSLQELYPLGDQRIAKGIHPRVKPDSSPYWVRFALRPVCNAHRDLTIPWRRNFRISFTRVNGCVVSFLSAVHA